MQQNKKKIKQIHKSAYEDLEKMTNEFMMYAEDVGAFSWQSGRPPGFEYFQKAKPNLTKIIPRSSQHGRASSQQLPIMPYETA